jgi:hypothetical protein
MMEVSVPRLLWHGNELHIVRRLSSEGRFPVKRSGTVNRQGIVWIAAADDSRVLSHLEEY